MRQVIGFLINVFSRIGLRDNKNPVNNCSNMNCKSHNYDVMVDTHYVKMFMQSSGEKVLPSPYVHSENSSTIVRDRALPKLYASLRYNEP